MIELVPILVALIVVAGAVAFAIRFRHPEQKPLAATLIFLTAFGAGTIVMFNLASLVFAWVGVDQMLGHGLVTILLVLVGLVPGFLLATWLIRRPPMRSPRI